MTLPIITHSIGLFLLVGCLLWAYLGVLVALRLGLSAKLGFLLGAAGWAFGVLALLVAGLRGRNWDRERGRVAPVGPSWLSVALAVSGGLLVCASAFVSWGRWRVAWASSTRLSGGATPADVPTVAIVIVLSGLAAVGAGLLWRFRGTGRWLAAGSILAAWWTTAAAEALIARSAIDSVTRDASRLGGRHVGATIGGGPGLWVMLAGCALIAAWAGLGAAALVGSARLRPAPLLSPGGPGLASPTPHVVPAEVEPLDPWGKSTDAWQ